MAQTFGFPEVTGVATANNGAATASVIAAQGAGKVLRLKRGILSVHVAATGNTGLARICDGSTTIISFAADAVGAWPFDLGDVGHPLTANTALQVIVSGAGTTQASATLLAVANVF
jgi:hypothetical protein